MSVVNLNGFEWLSFMYQSSIFRMNIVKYEIMVI